MKGENKEWKERGVRLVEDGVNREWRTCNQKIRPLPKHSSLAMTSWRTLREEGQTSPCGASPKKLPSPNQPCATRSTSRHPSSCPLA